MADTKAEKIGAKQSIIITLIALLVMEFCWLVSETQGDFANGIMFYITYHFNMFFILLYPLLFISAYFFGKIAGADILELKKGILITSTKCAALSSVSLTIYIIIFTLIHQSDILPILLDGLYLFIIFFITWFITNSLIHWRGKNLTESSE